MLAKLPQPVVNYLAAVTAKDTEIKLVLDKGVKKKKPHSYQ